MFNTRRVTLAIGCTQTLAWATTYYIPATMAGAAAAEFGASRAVMLGGFSLALLVCGLCSPWVGRRIDRLGGRGVMAQGALITATGLGLMAMSRSIPIWYLAWMVTGIGMAMGLYDAAFGSLGRLLGKDARAAITGVTLMAGFSNTLGWPLGAWLVGAYGWRAAVASYAAMQVLVILPMVLSFVPRPGPALPPAPVPPGGGAAPVDAAFFWMASHFMLRQAIASVISVHALVLLAGMGFGSAETVIAASLIGPAQVGSRVIDWFFGRRLNPMVAAMISSVLLPAAMLALGAGLPAFVFTLIYGISNGIYTINRGTLPLHLFGAAGYAARVGRLAMPAMIAAALAPTLIAPAISAWPTAWVMGLLAAFGVVALLCLLRLRR
jgi:hypothetical protein